MEKKRLYFLDNLKVFLTCLVIVHHVGQAYGPTGGFWQYKSSLGESASWLGNFFPVNASFFMGLFFMISGYFIPMSFDHKDVGTFLKDKLVRLGIPILFMFFIFVPLMMYFHYSLYSGNEARSFFDYLIHIYFGIGGMPEGFIISASWPEMNFGPAWFIEQLLVYSFIYMGVRKFLHFKLKDEEQQFNWRVIGVVCIVVMISSFVTRIWYPIDKWIGILGFIQSEVAHLPQYIILFLLGIIAYRRKYFTNCSKNLGYGVLALGILMGIVVYLRPVLPEWMLTVVHNSWNLYEPMMGVLLAWGIMILFREHANKTSKLLARLSSAAYTMYIMHMLVVLSVQYAFDRVNLGSATLKFIVVSIASIIITYILSIGINAFIKKVNVYIKEKPTESV